MKIDSLEALMKEELRDIYDAEKQIVKALPKMVKASESEELKSALQDHLQVTKNQIERLGQVFELLGQPARGRHCPGMKGILEEGEEVAAREAEHGMGDAGIIGAAQKVEHYEIAAYGTLKAFAEKLRMPNVAELLEETLQEEKQADQKLTEVSGEILQASEEEGEEIEEEEIEEEAEEDLDDDEEEEDYEEEEEETDEEASQEEEGRPQPVARRPRSPHGSKK